MFRKLVIAASMVVATWSVATASHAGFSINLPGFGMHLPLPGASVSIGLPFVASHSYPAYHGGARHEYRDYARHDSYKGNYGNRRSYGRPYDRDMSRPYGHGPGRYNNGHHTGFYGGR
jgi:hypothetical protein